MSDLNENSEPKRKPLKGAFLSQIIAKEIQEILSQIDPDMRQIILEHLILLFKDLESHASSKDDTVYLNFAKRETDMMKKYGKAIEPYRTHYFYKLFQPELLVEKGYYTTEEFNSLPNEQTFSSELEIKQVCIAMNKFLDWELQMCYMENTNGVSKGDELSGTNSKSEEKEKEATEARRLLAMYYFLKAGMGIEQHRTNSVSEIAQFIHFLFGVPFTTLQNSNIYSKYRKMPDYNSGEVLIKDLRYIRPYFETLNLHKVLELIDAQIKATNESLPYGRKNKDV